LVLQRSSEESRNKTKGEFLFQSYFPCKVVTGRENNRKRTDKLASGYFQLFISAWIKAEGTSLSYQ
jgi:hypothetical protein